MNEKSFSRRVMVHFKSKNETSKPKKGDTNFAEGISATDGVNPEETSEGLLCQIFISI